MRYSHNAVVLVAVLETNPIPASGKIQGTRDLEKTSGLMGLFEDPTLVPSASPIPSTFEPWELSSEEHSMTLGPSLVPSNKPSTSVEPSASLSPIPSGVPTGNTLPRIDDVSPAPPPSSAVQDCSLQASAECVLDNLVPCSLLSSLPPAFYTCKLPDILDLGWIMSGGSCADSTTTQLGFSCTPDDSSGFPEAVAIQVTGGTNKIVYLSTTFSIGEWFFLKNGLSAEFAMLDPTIVVTIKSLAGDVLQEMTINTECTEENDLTIGKTFGSLQLANYRNADAAVKGYEMGTWAYSVTNDGTIDASLTGLVTITNGVSSGPSNLPITLTPDEEFPIEVTQLFSLIDPGVTYSTQIDVSGSPGLCTASAQSSVTIGTLLEADDVSPAPPPSPAVQDCSLFFWGTETLRHQLCTRLILHTV